jgi:hypothetical protein
MGMGLVTPRRVEKNRALQPDILIMFILAKDCVLSGGRKVLRERRNNFWAE